MTTDYRTDKTTSTFTMANPDLLAGTGMYSSSPRVDIVTHIHVCFSVASGIAAES